MNVEIGTEAAQCLFWEFINGVFFAVRFITLSAFIWSTFLAYYLSKLQALTSFWLEKLQIQRHLF
jgi:hypothetical protein